MQQHIKEEAWCTHSNVTDNVKNLSALKMQLQEDKERIKDERIKEVFSKLHWSGSSSKKDKRAEKRSEEQCRSDRITKKGNTGKLRGLYLEVFDKQIRTHSRCTSRRTTSPSGGSCGC